jgi:5'-nucleotidase
MRVLVTNDDGIHAEGLLALVQALDVWVAQAPEGEERVVTVVAPDTNYSGAGAAVGDMYLKPGLAYSKVELAGVSNIPCFGLDATPALCAIVGNLGGFGPRYDVIVSGINAGVNVGRSVLHSGTVGACLTGTQLGLAGLAVSVRTSHETSIGYGTAAALAVAALADLASAPVHTVINLNVPNVELKDLKGVRRARISTAGIIKSSAGETPTLPTEPFGMIPLTLGSSVPDLGDVSDEADDDDGALVAAGYAAVTVIRSVHEAGDDEADALARNAVLAMGEVR